MPQTNQQDTPRGLTKLPTDVLLNIFNGCDLTDILNLALTCKELHITTEERHVWLAQFKRRCTPFRQAPFQSRTKELYLHSTAQLKSWTIQQARTDALWLQNEDTIDNLKFQNVRINDPEDVQYESTFLLPGGEHLVVFTTDGDIILKRIERGNSIGDPELALVDVARCSPPGPCSDPGCTVEVFTDTICECPLISFHNWEDASVTIFRLDYDSQTISAQKKIQVNPHGGPLGYRMDYLGIRGDTVMWFYADQNGEYRKHLIVAKLDDPDSAATGRFDVNWGVYSQRAGISHFEVLAANAFIRYNRTEIHLYHVPHLSSGIQSRDKNNKPPTPTVIWSYCHDSGQSNAYGGLYYDRTDAIFPNFYLHNREYSHTIEFGMGTPVDAECDPHVGYPIVLNHTVIPTSDNSTCCIASQRPGRKRAYPRLNSAHTELRLNTVLLDNRDRPGCFRVPLGQHGLLGIDTFHFQATECDEVTGRMFLFVDEGYLAHFFLADLPRP